jgi:hypothetical protein
LGAAHLACTTPLEESGFRELISGDRHRRGVRFGGGFAMTLALAFAIVLAVVVALALVVAVAGAADVVRARPAGVLVGHKVPVLLREGGPTRDTGRRLDCERMFV